MKIKEKLRSSKGASLIIALVFMLFCAMVGSAVLAAATANGGRIAALKSDQQAYLNQRSAATLLSDELQINKPKLTVEKKEVVRTTYTVSDGGVITLTNSKTTKTIDFKVNGNVTTPLQCVLFESAILRYMQANDIDMDGYTVTIDGKKIESISAFNILKGENPECTLTVDLSEGSDTSVTNFSARVGCVGPAPQNSDANKTVAPYTFNVSFVDDAKLYLRMYAATGSPNEYTYETQEPGSSSTELVKVKTTKTTQTISWDPPEILKGEAKWND